MSLALIVAVLVLLPQVAMACPVCFAGLEGDSRIAFIITTAFLTFLPLTLLGGTIWWLWRRSCELEADRRPDMQGVATRRSSSSPDLAPGSAPRRSSAA